MGIKGKNILVTCGPTWVPVDGVRVISNISSGALGRGIALELAGHGAKITVLQGPVAAAIAGRNIRVRKFEYYDDLQALIAHELKKKYDVMIHAAAVSDYRLKRKLRKKISSNRDRLTLELTPTKKIIDSVKKIDPDIFLVGFKLETNVTKTSARRLAQRLQGQTGCDLIVVNSIPNDQYRGYVLGPNQDILARQTTRQGMAKALTKILKERL